MLAVLEFLLMNTATIYQTLGLFFILFVPESLLAFLKGEEAAYLKTYF
jgi:hypothetical protein